VSGEARPAGSYGVDAPWVPWLWMALGVLYVVLAVLQATSWGSPWWSTVLVGGLGIVFLCCGALFWYASLCGKFAVWARLLDAVHSPRRMLDLGCGHGAVAIMAALRAPGVQVDGIDLWRSIDQSANSAAAAEANASLNGVADRIRFATGDMTSLPYPTDTYDLVTASFSMHNIRTAEGRRTAVDEAWRVLAPGGLFLVLDISKTQEYQRRLHELGAVDLTSRDAGWRVWWSGPWMRSRAVTARKPGIAA